MSDIDEYSLSHVAFAVLGLVAEKTGEGGCHAKYVDEMIEERGMRNWTAIGTSSIYGVLKKLKDDGLVTSEVDELDNRIIKNYQVTDYGFRVLKNTILKTISEYIGKNDEDFYVAYSNLPLLTKNEAIQAFSSSMEKMKIHIKELEEMLSTYNAMPPGKVKLAITGLFKHPIMIMQKDIEFLERVLEQLNKIKDEN